MQTMRGMMGNPRQHSPAAADMVRNVFHFSWRHLRRGALGKAQKEGKAPLLFIRRGTPMQGRRRGKLARAAQE